MDGQSTAALTLPPVSILLVSHSSPGQGRRCRGQARPPNPKTKPQTLNPVPAELCRCTAQAGGPGGPARHPFAARPGRPRSQTRTPTGGTRTSRCCWGSPAQHVLLSEYTGPAACTRCYRVVADLLLVAGLGGRSYRQGSGYHLHCCRCDAGYSRPASSTLEQQATSLHPATDRTRDHCWLGACRHTVLICRGGHTVCSSQWAHVDTQY